MPAVIGEIPNGEARIRRIPNDMDCLDWGDLDNSARPNDVETFVTWINGREVPGIGKSIFMVGHNELLWVLPKLYYVGEERFGHHWVEAVHPVELRSYVGNSVPFKLREKSESAPN